MLAENNEYLKEAAESLYRANADEIVRQQCRAREDAERRERTLERDNQRLRADNETLKEDNETLKEDNKTLKEDNEALKERERRSIVGMMDFCKEMGLIFEETVVKIAEKFDVSPDEMREQIEGYWNK